MADKSRIKFNPATREIEVEGSESFVKSYFAKIQKLLAAEESPAEKTGNIISVKGPAYKRGNIYETVMGIIRSSGEGINTSGLRDKTGLTSQQIRSVIYRAEKQGMIRKAKRGLYAPVS